MEKRAVRSVVARFGFVFANDARVVHTRKHQSEAENGCSQHDVGRHDAHEFSVQIGGVGACGTHGGDLCWLQLNA